MVISVLAIFLLASVIWGYNQKLRADQQEALAIENATLAKEAKKNLEKEMMNQQIFSTMAHKAVRNAQVEGEKKKSPILAI